jgi:hypothetical protein
MVDKPSKYPWSSYQINGRDKQSGLCKPHEQEVALGTSAKERLSEYRNLFKEHIEDSLITDI